MGIYEGLHRRARVPKRRLEAVQSQQAQGETPAQSVPKVGRNDPCPCGSGRKYKRCHGKK